MDFRFSDFKLLFIILSDFFRLETQKSTARFKVLSKYFANSISRSTTKNRHANHTGDLSIKRYAFYQTEYTAR
ncbi:hypothetical protein BGP_2976 [Beggiatoa sp. PS]|nr:hypothetical protein BGP_2976 [Beggiatoa sp. PS]